MYRGKYLLPVLIFCCLPGFGHPFLSYNNRRYGLVAPSRSRLSFLAFSPGSDPDEPSEELSEELRKQPQKKGDEDDKAFDALKIAGEEADESLGEVSGENVERPAEEETSGPESSGLSSAEPVDLFPKLRRELAKARQDESTIERILEALKAASYESEEDFLFIVAGYQAMKDFAGLKAEIQTMPGMPTKSKSLPGMVATAAVKALEQASIAEGEKNAATVETTTSAGINPESGRIAFLPGEEASLQRFVRLCRSEPRDVTVTLSDLVATKEMHDLDEAPFLPKVTSEEGTDPQDRAEAMLSQIRDDLSSQSSESLVRVSVIRRPGESPILEGLVLPKGMIWPVFVHPKLKFSPGQRMIFRRLSAHDISREDVSVDWLLKKRMVVWIGVPGVGKSASVAVLLRRLLRQLGTRDDLNEVCLRTGKIIYAFRVGEDGELTVRKHSGKDLDSVFWYSRSLEERGILLLELDEMEMDPNVWCPTFSSASNRGADLVFKTMRKGGVEVFLAGLYTFDEAIAAALLLFLDDISAPLEQLHEKLNQVYTRFRFVGGSLRFLFGDERSFQDRATTLSDLVQGFEIDLETASVYNVPQSAGMLVQPTSKECPPSSYANVTFEIVSQEASKILAIRSYKMIDLARSMKRLGVPQWQLAETIVEQALLYNPELPGVCRVDRWKWHKNQDGAALEEELRGFQPDEALKCSVIQLYNAPRLVFEKNIEDLLGGTVYRAKQINIKLHDWIVVDTDKRHCYAIQVTRQNPAQKRYTVADIKELRAALQMTELWTLRLVVVVPSKARREGDRKLRGFKIVGDDDQKLDRSSQAYKDLFMEEYVVFAGLDPDEGSILQSDISG